MSKTNRMRITVVASNSAEWEKLIRRIRKEMIEAYGIPAEYLQLYSDRTAQEWENIQRERDRIQVENLLTDMGIKEDDA